MKKLAVVLFLTVMAHFCSGQVEKTIKCGQSILVKTEGTAAYATFVLWTTGTVFEEAMVRRKTHAEGRERQVCWEQPRRAKYNIPRIRIQRRFIRTR